MVEEPDRMRQNIEATRASLTRDVDRLAEKTSPRQAARRRWTAVREKVMGSTESTANRVEEKAQDAADAVRSAPRAVATQTQGNPLAAGIIAFGVGMLAATLMPVTEAERRAGQQLKEHSGDLTEKVKDVAGDLKEDLSGSARHAVDEVRSTAQDAVQTTRNA
ncbi:DUF3618 domain-containing protein [Actinoplanes subtropicus]|uniref:DUF3618 domain-containing protein n=1 Tax=Actinoplanes subtropicus TaxID=543632 RepID=UPI00068A2EBD|nr:DUF3618 domain-containing protein [Actinoplanes subtropicus]